MRRENSLARYFIIFRKGQEETLDAEFLSLFLCYVDNGKFTRSMASNGVIILGSNKNAVPAFHSLPWVPEDIFSYGYSLTRLRCEPSVSIRKKISSGTQGIHSQQRRPD